MHKYAHKHTDTQALICIVHTKFTDPTRPKLQMLKNHEFFGLWQVYFNVVCNITYIAYKLLLCQIIHYNESFKFLPVVSIISNSVV